MKIQFACLISLAIGVGCATSGPKVAALRVPFSEVAQHAGERVHVCGWLQANIEECSLSSASDVTDPSKQVWIISRAKVCQPKYAVLAPTSGWVELEGTIASGASYGHLGLYPVSISTDTLIFRKAPCK